MSSTTKTYTVPARFLAYYNSQPAPAGRAGYARVQLTDAERESMRQAAERVARDNDRDQATGEVRPYPLVVSALGAWRALTVAR